MMDDVALAMRGITKTFPGVRALDGVDLTVHKGEVHALLGENGAGKSTLMNILSGAFTEYGGGITVGGTPADIHHPRDAQRLGIAMIHQELNLVPHLSIADNIFLGREPLTGRGTLDRARIQRSTRELLSRLGLQLSPARPIRRCRLAEQQLIEVAKAISVDVRILVMDEPTSALADAEVARLFDIIRSLTADGVAVVYISHRLEELEEIADTVTVLRDGQQVGTRPMAGAQRADLIQLMVGRPIGELFPRTTDTVESEKALEIDGLTLTADAVAGRPALRDVSLSVHKGEIVGLAGLMGAGRTEVLESVFGVHPRHAVSGAFRVAGKPYVARSPRQAIARGITLIAEDRKTQSLVLGNTVQFNTTLASLRRFLRWTGVSRRDERAEVRRQIADLRIKTPSPATPVRTLSGGNQQKVVLAKCLLTRPAVLLMDEPTRGIDVGAKAEIYELMNRLAGQGAAILMVSSELPELLAMCDRIVVLCEGRVTGEFDRAEATQERILEAAMARQTVLQ
jgi:ribose transport system ATP-binding protein